MSSGSWQVSPTGRERVETALQDAPSLGERPALGKLSAGQGDILGDLLDGFDTRREVLRWMGDVVIHTVGALDDDWFSEVAADAGVISALLGQPWGTVDPVQYDDRWADEVRRGLAAKDVLPATREAHREFRWSAAEYHDDPNYRTTPDPDEQQHPGMRPALSNLQEQLTWSLDRLLAGFEDADEILVWGQRSVQASYAELESDVVEGAFFELPVRKRFLVDDVDPIRARFFRESWGAEYLLPGFNRAASALSSRSSEVPEVEQTTQTIPSG